jgi:hypothetical protein
VESTNKSPRETSETAFHAKDACTQKVARTHKGDPWNPRTNPRGKRQKRLSTQKTRARKRACAWAWAWAGFLTHLKIALCHGKTAFRRIGCKLKMRTTSPPPPTHPCRVRGARPSRTRGVRALVAILPKPGPYVAQTSAPKGRNYRNFLPLSRAGAASWRAEFLRYSSNVPFTCVRTARARGAGARRNL